MLKFSGSSYLVSGQKVRGGGAAELRLCGVFEAPGFPAIVKAQRKARVRAQFGVRPALQRVVSRG